MKKWYKKSVVYQIYPLTFKDGNGDGIGDLRGIIDEIPYLKSLGINAVWLSPINCSPMNDNGYDISDYLNINPLFGTIDDFKELITKLHQNSIKLIMDLVVNHSSSEHRWFKEAIKNKNSKYHDYYFFKDKLNNWTSFFGGSAWEYNKDTNEYYLHLFDKSQPDLNWDNPQLRDEIKKILKYWLDLGVDGFRCDVINVISKKEGLPDGNPNSGVIGIEHYANGVNLHKYLKELYDDVFSKYDAFTVGECGIQSIEDTIKLTTNELDTIFNFEHFSIDELNNKWNYKLINISDLKKSFAEIQRRYNEFNIWNTLVLENHDQPRSISRYGDLKYRYESASLLAAYVFLLQGTPFIYQGEEIGMTNYPFNNIDDFKDLESINYYQENINKVNQERLFDQLKHKSRDNARSVMQWNNEVNAGFSKTKTNLLINPNYKSINVEKDLKEEYSLIDFYKELIKLKIHNKVFIYGKYFDYDLQANDHFIYERTYNDDTYLVVGNLTNQNNNIVLPYKAKKILSNLKEELDYFLPYQVKIYRKEG